MAKLVERCRLHVEGGDDMHAIRHPLIRHGIDYDHDPWPTWFPSIDAVRGGKNAIVGSETVETAVSLSTGRAVGFVLDADSSVEPIDGGRFPIACGKQVATAYALVNAASEYASNATAPLMSPARVDTLQFRCGSWVDKVLKRYRPALASRPVVDFRPGSMNAAGRLLDMERTGT